MCLENKLKEIHEIIKNVRSGGRPIGHYTFTLNDNNYYLFKSYQVSESMLNNSHIAFCFIL